MCVATWDPTGSFESHPYNLISVYWIPHPRVHTHQLQTSSAESPTMTWPRILTKSGSSSIPSTPAPPLHLPPHCGFAAHLCRPLPADRIEMAKRAISSRLESAFASSAHSLSVYSVNRVESLPRPRHTLILLADEPRAKPSYKPHQPRVPKSWLSFERPYHRSTTPSSSPHEHYLPFTPPHQSSVPSTVKVARQRSRLTADRAGDLMERLLFDAVPVFFAGPFVFFTHASIP